MGTGKIRNLEELIDIVQFLRTNEKKIVFTNGCFDILHIGHINYLKRSRDLGDILIVGLNSDSSVKRLKGDTRPINNETARAAMLEALEMVGYVVVFEEDNPKKIIQALKPDIYTKGGDYNLENIIGVGLGSDIIESYGGRVELISIEHGISTTELIMKLNNK